MCLQCELQDRMEQIGQGDSDCPLLASDKLLKPPQTSYLNLLTLNFFHLMMRVVTTALKTR